MLQRDAMVRKAKSKQELEQETTKAHTHDKHQPTNAGQQRYTSHKRQTPARPRHMHLNNTTHRTLCHRGTSHRHSGTAPTAGATGTRAAHLQLKPRRRGNPPAPVMKPRHRSAGVMGRNKQNRRNLGRSKLRTRSHTCPFCVATEMVK